MAEDTEQMAIDAEESAAIEDMAEDDYTDEPSGQIERFVTEKFKKAETSRRGDEERWIQAIEIIEVCMVLKFSLHPQKSQEFL